ncbi:MAG: TIGR04255 family protein [Solirubrobacterales bacterium]
MGFEKPPVVEAWIEFRFALTQEDSRWDEDAARSLMKRCFEDFIPDRLLQSIEVDVNIAPGQSRPTATPEIFFERVRAHSPDGNHCIQVGRDTLVFNQLTKGKWLGYLCMLEGAVSAAQKYVDFRGFDELTAVSLHYRDIVEIPKTTDSGIELREWFRVYPEVPEDSFGPMAAFRFAIRLPVMCKDVVTVLSVQSVPLVAEANPAFRFALDWHVSSTDKISSLDNAKQWLDAAHGALRGSFEKAFTQKCLELFGLKEGE